MIPETEHSMDKKPLLKVHFTDFWTGFDPEENFFINILRALYDVHIDSVNPDILFYSYKGKEFLKYRCNRVFFTGENIRPRLSDCDYALCFDFAANPRIIRLPLYVLYKGFEKLIVPKNIDNIIAQKNKFCSFIVSNKYAPKRIEFFNKLSKYKKVDSGGRYLNNIGYNIDDKLEFLNPYKFDIAFENSSYPGYTTEKIMQPMVAGSIPVYWGNPLVDRDFNSKSFINWHDYGSDEAVIEKIIELDTNEDKYREMLAESWLTGNITNKYNDLSNIKQELKSIVIDAQTHTPVGTIAVRRIVSVVYNCYVRPVENATIKLRRKIVGF